MLPVDVHGDAPSGRFDGDGMLSGGFQDGAVSQVEYLYILVVTLM